MLFVSALLALVSANLVPTIDNSCGPKSGTNTTQFACVNGLCCSQYGFCGTGDLYCGLGCETLYGSCAAAPSVTYSPDNTCGATSKGKYTCPSGSCCSGYGFCGTDAAQFCGFNCQPLYGSCGSLPQPTSL